MTSVPRAAEVAAAVEHRSAYSLPVRRGEGLVGDFHLLGDILQHIGRHCRGQMSQAGARIAQGQQVIPPGERAALRSRHSPAEVADERV